MRCSKEEKPRKKCIKYFIINVKLMEEKPEPITQ